MLVFPFSLCVNAAEEKISISKIPKTIIIKWEVKIAAVAETSLVFNLMPPTHGCICLIVVSCTDTVDAEIRAFEFATIHGQQYPVLIMVTSVSCQMSLDATKKLDLPLVNLTTTVPFYKKKIDTNRQKTRNFPPSSRIRAPAWLRATPRLIVALLGPRVAICGPRVAAFRCSLNEGLRSGMLPAIIGSYWLFLPVNTASHHRRGKNQVQKSHH